MTESLERDPVGTALGAAAVGIGVLGALSPTTFRGLYGVADDSAEATYLTRLFSTRNLVLGALALAAGSPADRKRMATATVALNAMDVAIGLASTGEGVSTRTRLLGPLTSVAFGVGSVVVARRS